MVPFANAADDGKISIWVMAAVLRHQIAPLSWNRSPGT